MGNGKIYIGTSGWKYEYWNGQSTVANFKQWKDNVPEDFVYPVTKVVMILKH